MSDFSVTDFESAVKNRANERMQAKIEACRKAIYLAIKELCGSTYLGQTPWLHRSWPSEHKTILQQLASDNNREGWPTWLWEKEEKCVRAELLAVMDEMKKALLAQPMPDGDRPSTDSENEEGKER